MLPVESIDRVRRDQARSQAELTDQLLRLGVRPGGVLLVHCAFSRVRPVEGGPLGLIEALQDALGPDGTLVMPSMADDDVSPFDPQRTPCIGMGIVAHTFWQQPHVLRSDSPHAFAARGPHAAAITQSHPVDIAHGLESPVGRVYEMDGQILLLGVNHDANTTIHLAELLAGVRYRRPASAYIMENGRPTRVEYGENDHCCENFTLVDGWLDAQDQQSHSRISHAQARLMNSRDVVAVVVPQLQRDETRFLHPFGIDEECDEARASLVRVRRGTPDDAAGIVAVLNPIIESGQYTVLDRPFSVEEERDFLRNLPDRSILHVAETINDGRIVGFQILEPYAAYTSAFDHVGVMGTYVDLPLRRLGIASRLFAATFTRAQELGFEKISTFVKADNAAALKIYQQHGFEMIGISKRQAKIDGQYVDEIIIEKPL
jgi:aminoglycoside N3'-acetyltransferase/L-amino acid N-acyltransferase YncA